MLSEARNKLLTEVGPGTPMGELLRRYWQPIAAVAELDDNPAKPVRLLGEDLVLYKDLSGRYGLVERHCPHRSADLSYGMVEAVRAALQLSRLAVRRDRARAASNRSRTSTRRKSASATSIRIKRLSGGGEGRAALGLSRPGTRRRCCRTGSRSPGTMASSRSCSPSCRATGCSARRTRSIRCISSGCTTTGSAAALAATVRHAPRHLKLGFDEFEYGLVYRRVREGADEADPLWTDRPRLPVAERAVHRQPFRMARADRRHATR